MTQTTLSGLLRRILRRSSSRVISSASVPEWQDVRTREHRQVGLNSGARAKTLSVEQVPGSSKPRASVSTALNSRTARGFVDLRLVLQLSALVTLRPESCHRSGTCDSSLLYFCGPALFPPRPRRAEGRATRLRPMASMSASSKIRSNFVLPLNLF